jgi:hypothetical protein
MMYLKLVRLFNNHLTIPHIDAPDENILKFFLQASSFLNHVHNVKGRVLVHCISGILYNTIILYCTLIRLIVRCIKICDVSDVVFNNAM